jgi:hypothetical protein
VRTNEEVRTEEELCAEEELKKRPGCVAAKNERRDECDNVVYS